MPGKKGKKRKKKTTREQASEKRESEKPVAEAGARKKEREELGFSWQMERRYQELVAGIKRKSVEEESEAGKKMKRSSSSSRFGRICVFCGSSSGKRTSYQEAVIELGKELVDRNIDLVYDGGSIGLMGLVSDAVRAGGRHILRVIPKSLMPKEITGGTMGDVRIVSNMHERKAEMARAADSFIALPRGYGTLEELSEVITWAQLGIHSKPVGLLNVDGYYDSLLSFIDSAVAEEFISSKARRILISAPSPKELLRKLKEYVPERDELVTQLNWDVSDVGSSDSEPRH